MIKALIILFILSLPYNNFPYGVGGTLTPFALVPLSVISLLLFINFLKLGCLKINRYFYFVYVVFLIFFIITIFNDIYFWEYFKNSKNTSPFFRTFQFAIYIYISIGSLIVGYISLKYFKHINLILKLILLSFFPSIIFGILEIIFSNNHILNFIRSFVANTSFPDGYYRIYMLTTEPSWAAFDIVSFLIPIALYLYNIKKKIIYLILLALLLILLIFTKSLLGFFTFIVSSMIVSIIFYKKIIKKPQYLFSIITIILLFSGSILLFKDVYIERAISFFSGNDSSGLTRTASYIVAIETFQKYPILGVGFRNTGYFYDEIISSTYPELMNIGLIEDWADFYSKRFPDVKSTVLEILSSAGIIGLSILLIFGVLLYNKLKNIKDEHIKILFLYIFIACFIGSFSMNLIGYPIFWFFLGLLLRIHKYKERVLWNTDHY